MASRRVKLYNLSIMCYRSLYNFTPISDYATATPKMKLFHLYRRNRSFKKVESLELGIFLYHQEHLEEQKNESNPGYCLELFVILRIDGSLYISFGKLIDFLLEYLLRIVGIVDTDIYAITCSGNLLTHLLIELSHDDIALFITAEVIATGRNGREVYSYDKE